MISAIPYFAYNITALFDMGDWEIRVQCAYYLLEYIITLALAAQAHRKVRMDFGDNFY